MDTLIVKKKAYDNNNNLSSIWTSPDTVIIDKNIKDTITIEDNKTADADTLSLTEILQDIYSKLNKYGTDILDNKTRLDSYQPPVQWISEEEYKNKSQQGELDPKTAYFISDDADGDEGGYAIIKLDEINPRGVGYFAMNINSDYTPGKNSVVLGDDCKADGSNSYAQGDKVKVSGKCSHGEGYSTDIIGDYSHAEGFKTACNANRNHAEGGYSKANGEYSHAEGYKTTALGRRSHAEGNSTLAYGDSQHVQGKYNIKDTEEKYAHIIGNGTDMNNRSNALTVDWNGNLEALGKICGKNGLILNGWTMKLDISTPLVGGADNQGHTYEDIKLQKMNLILTNDNLDYGDNRIASATITINLLDKSKFDWDWK